ncbi:MAG TPA: magnesium-translocating P-type ATPase [Mycobacteriales bacterium]|nr:magnesium-translocating P-type ATPase [Mycobacteriales bacterium]
MLVSEAAALSADQVLREVDSQPAGLTAAAAAERLAHFGRNALRSHHTQALQVLLRQVRSPLLLLLAATATASFFLGERNDAAIIAVILTLSIGLGFFNEYRAEKATEALHSQIRHLALVMRDGSPQSVDITELVHGDVLVLRLGEVIPADVRLLSVSGLECDESAMTGESLPVEKSLEAVPASSALAELRCCGLMGTVVHAGTGTGVVVATGGGTEFGRIALELGERHPETEFQAGLRKFSMLLAEVAGLLTSAVLVVNIVLGRSVIEALLFSLAIAVGITPQLLPAVVSSSLAAGSRRLARRQVLVKRLVCIEDLGDIEVLLTDKTGTLTDGRIAFMRALAPDGTAGDDALLLGLLACEVTVGRSGAVAANSLDDALWTSPASAVARETADRYQRVAVLPFDHDRRLLSVLVDDPTGNRVLVTKGAPEAILARCERSPESATTLLDREFAAGHRIVAVATRPAAGLTTIAEDDERQLALRGFLVFLDPPKASAASALARLAGLGVTVKVVTGDNPTVATTVCEQLGLAAGGVMTGAEVDALDDDELRDKVATTSVFARVSPEHKARIVRAERRRDLDVAFLGDGVNDAVALHAADVGISVDTATDVAKDAADVILLEKDLNVLADGVAEGRRIFANTIKYVLMGTSSNFGNMVSAAGASAVLNFLPMLPGQILLNNLLYDGSQLAIPTDEVDAEQLVRPSRWDIGFIRRFMLVFGPLSSLFDFGTFAILVWGFHAHAGLFRTGWFVESLATQTLVIFVIRTRRSPFTRSRPSVPLLLAAIGAVAVGALLPLTPLAHTLGFRSPPARIYVVIAGLVVGYLVLIETAKRRFFAAQPAIPHVRERRAGYRIGRRAARFSVGHAISASRRPSRRTGGNQ